MPKGNKGQKNGLTLYILTELMPELARKGERYPNGLRDLVPIALPLYQNLPPEEKARFENMAKLEKAKQRQTESYGNRRDNLGNLIEERQDPKDIMRAKRQRDRAELQTLFNNLKDSDLLEEKFYFIGFQFMVCTQDGVYLPLEYGVVEWSMAKGVTKTIHGFINPGDIPLGYRFIAKDHSEQSHKIPLEKFDQGDSNYKGIWMKLERFVEWDATQSTPAPLYCMETEHKVVAGCLSWLQYHSGMSNCFRINILEELTTMLFLRSDFKISEASVSDLLTTSAYDFESNTKCAQHDEVEAKHCALGCPKKYTFALSDALSERFKFSLTPSHLPTAPVSQNATVFVDNNRLLQQEPSSRGRGKTTVEPVTFGSRDVRCFPSQSGSGMAGDSGDRNDQQKDHFPPSSSSSRGFPSPSGGKYRPLEPTRFANSAPKAPEASSVPNPSPALLQSSGRAQARSETTYDETVATNFQNLDIQDKKFPPNIQDKKFSPKRPEPLGQPKLFGASALGVQGQPLYPERRPKDNNFSDDDCEETLSVTGSYLTSVSNQQDAASHIPPAVPLTTGRGRGFADFPQVQMTPARVGSLAASESMGRGVLFSPVGRGRAFVSAMDQSGVGHRPPPGFGAKY